MNNALKQYQKGLHLGKLDYEKYGEDFMKQEIKYGLNGKSRLFCHGYEDYLRRFVRGK